MVNSFLNLQKENDISTRDGSAFPILDILLLQYDNYTHSDKM